MPGPRLLNAPTRRLCVCVCSCALAQVVVVDAVSGKAEIWEPCENRSLARYRGSKPVMVTAYYGVAPTHSLEVDRLSAAAAASSPQVRGGAVGGPHTGGWGDSAHGGVADCSRVFVLFWGCADPDACGCSRHRRTAACKLARWVSRTP